MNLLCQIPWTTFHINHHMFMTVWYASWYTSFKDKNLENNAEISVSRICSSQTQWLNLNMERMHLLCELYNFLFQLFHITLELCNFFILPFYHRFQLICLFLFLCLNQTHSQHILYILLYEWHRNKPDKLGNRCMTMTAEFYHCPWTV